MPLTLTVLRCPPTVAPEVRQVTGGEFSIGRGPENDWVLPDPIKHLSKRHCLIAFRNGVWQVAGTSTNGTFINRDQEPLESRAPHTLADGDRLILGVYEIEVRLVEEARSDWGSAGKPDPFGDPFSDDPLLPGGNHRAPPPAAASGHDFPGHDYSGHDFPGHDFPGHDRSGHDRMGHDRSGRDLPPFASSLHSFSLPAEFDPLFPDKDEVFPGPTQADHTPAVSDAFSLPPVKSVLPDDWDLEDLAPRSEPRPAPASSATPPPRQAGPMIEAPAAAPASAQVAASGDLLAAFFRGAGLEQAALADPVQTMEQLGAAFRAMVSGIRQALIARSEVKREFRIEATVIRSRGNNLLKFSANDDDALAGLLGAGRRTDMGAEEAITDALTDIRLHELATMTAMQSAVRALVARLGPDQIRDAKDQAGGRALLSNRKARAWDSYEALHAQILRGLSDDFDSVFGKRFALAYEQAMEELLARQKHRGGGRR
jgi:type VI secretion system protein ImpI